MAPKPSIISPIPTNHFRTRAAEIHFTASCETLTAQFLSTLAASKPGAGGQIPKLGTGVGLGSAYLASVVRIWTGQAGRWSV